MGFENFALPEIISSNIASLGWEKPTHIQDLVLAPALEGSDILGGAPTGTGKSGAFLIPALVQCLKKGATGVPRVLILEPTRELGLQICEVAEKLSFGTELSCGTVIGGGDREAQRDLVADLVVATPGRLGEVLRKGWLDPDSIEMLIIDEADRMLDLGFYDEVKGLASRLVNRSQTMLFSATLEGAGIQGFASELLNDPFEVRVGVGGESDEKLPELLKSRAYYADSPEKKVSILLHLLSTTRNRALIFVRTKDRVSLLAGRLKRAGFTFATLQGDFSQAERNAAISRFKEGEVSLLIATDVAARGLDLPEVQRDYNFDLPRQAIIYVHRAGRTARAGASGVVVSFVERSEIATLERIERYTGRDIERRQIKGLCAAFPLAPEEKTLGRRSGRAATQGQGGFDRKGKEEEKKRVKLRHRVLKNKGKPDFAAKRARKAALAQAREEKKAALAAKKAAKPNE